MMMTGIGIKGGKCINQDCKNIVLGRSPYCPKCESAMICRDCRHGMHEECHAASCMCAKCNTPPVVRLANPKVTDETLAQGIWKLQTGD